MYFDFKNEFENDLNGGSLSFESGLNYSPENVLAIALDDGDALDAELGLESAISALASADKSYAAIAKIDDIVAYAKKEVDDGTITYETAIKIAANINTALATVSDSFDISYFAGETFTMESAQDYTIATVNAMIYAFSDEVLAFENAEDPSFKEKAKKQWEKFKAFVVRVTNAAIGALKNGYNFVMNLFRKQGPIIDGLIEKCDSLGTTLKDGAGLKQKQFAGVFPYLSTHSKSVFSNLVDTWKNDGKTLGSLGGALTSELANFGADFNWAKVKDKIKGYGKFHTIAGLDAKVTGIYLNYPGRKIKILVEDAETVLKVNEVEGAPVSPDSKITPLSVSDIKTVLVSLKQANDYNVKVLKGFPDSIKALRGSKAGDAVAMKMINGVINAVTLYTKSSPAMIRAVYSTMGKHMNVYQPKTAEA